MLQTLLIVAVLASGCSTTTSSPQVSVSGAYALTSVDIRSIQELVVARREIPEPIRSIHTDRRNHAQVSTGMPTHRVGSGSIFTVAKHNGHWMIDSPIQEEHVIVEGHN